MREAAAEAKAAHDRALAEAREESQKLLQRDDEPGRIVAMEILNNTYAISNLIRQIKPEQIFTILQTHSRDVPEQRMTTFERSLARLVRTGKISLAEAERSANHPQILADELAREQ